jgi:PEP-CTERM motif
MKTSLLIAIGLVALWGSGAQAAQITFGPSDQSITFTGNGANSVTVSSPTLTGPAFDTTNGAVGSFTLLFRVETFTAGPQVGGLFTVHDNTETFIYRNPDGDTIAETWHINLIQDNTPQPKFFGTGITTDISGDAAFLAAFGPVGTIDSFDFIEMPITCAVPANCTTLDLLATTTTSASAPISSGEKFTTTSVVPEPTTLALLGSALFGLGWLGRRRDKAA